MNIKIFNLEKIKIIFKIIKYNSLKIINIKNFLKILYLKLNKYKNIKIKFGIDPTCKNIHLGHIYYFLKLINLSFLYLLIKILLIIGIKTSLLKNYKFNKLFLKNSLYLIYNLKYILGYKLNILKFYYNSEWINIININEKIFLILLLNFKKFFNIKKYNYNFKNLYYIILQSYDTLFTKSNIEIGGLDQKINFLFCYNFIYDYLKDFQFYINFPIIFNCNKKISKSKKNFFFNFKNNKILILKINKKIKFLNYLKLIVLFNKNHFLYNFKNYNLFFFKIYLLKNIFIKYFLSIKTFNIFKKNFYLKIFLFSFIVFKIFKKFFKFKKLITYNNFIFSNNIIIYNKNFIFFKGNYIIKNNNLILHLYIF
ncbi:Leucyl-tRNA synthetase [Candidatus Nasuia deltocephalinicola]|uniref:Leucyl-tRNA synthetase n=1 Tax=Candidatus Nasuia deltocephalincola TaxID=1160784 RepID=A0A7G6UHW5_9PROT|nr:Leucyl-tRNA synthetase [Candidatus Nasuia deltocephalinicola]